MAAAKSTGAKRSTARKRTTSKAKTEKKAAPRSTKKFIRNATGVHYRQRLERQADTKYPLALEPRGMRGDTAPIQKDDLNDPGLSADIAAGFVEVITEAEALEVIAKQTINQQAAHPALSALRNEYGEEYGPDALKVEESWEEQGITVARLDESGQIIVDRQGNIERPDDSRYTGLEPKAPAGVVGQEVQPNQRREGIVSQQPPVQEGEAADRAAREGEGLASGLGGVQRVVVTPPKKD